MFGNKSNGDDLAREFQRLIEMNKVAACGGEDKMENLAADLQNHSEDEVVDPAQFLDFVDEAPEVTDQLDSEVSNLEAWADDPSKEDDCGDKGMYSTDTSYLLDQRATTILNGLGKIAGSLAARGETFAADVVEATALSIRKDMVKEASDKLKTINMLSKVASDISKEGDQFTADIVNATILKIKNQKG